MLLTEMDVRSEIKSKLKFSLPGIFNGAVLLLISAVVLYAAYEQFLK